MTTEDIRKYLNTRTDDNPALFVSIRYLHKRLLSGGTEIMLQKMEEQSDMGDLGYVLNVSGSNTERTDYSHLLAESMLSWLR